MTRKGFEEWWYWKGGFHITGLAICFILLAVGIWLALWSEAEDQRQWQAFVEAHECRVVGKVSGSTYVGVGGDSKGAVVTTVIISSDKTSYSCNDGVTYWRCAHNH